MNDHRLSKKIFNESVTSMQIESQGLFYPAGGIAEEDGIGRQDEQFVRRLRCLIVYYKREHHISYSSSNKHSPQHLDVKVRARILDVQFDKERVTLVMTMYVVFAGVKSHDLVAIP